MGTRSRRQKLKNRAKKRAGAVEVTAANLHELPRPFRLIIETTDHFHRYLEASRGDPAEAATAALNDACEAARLLGQLAEPFDAFDVLECVRLTEVPTNPETYRETEHEGSAAVIELSAFVLAARGHRAGSTPDEEGHRARPDAIIEEFLAECRRALAAGSIVPLLQRLHNGPGVSIELGAISREINVRNLSYTHMLEQTLDGLFDDPTIEQVCRNTIGCSVQEIRSVFAALQALHQEQWQRRFDVLRELSKLARVEMSAATATLDDYTISPEAKAKGNALWAQAWGDLADASNFAPEIIAEKAGVEASTVERVLGIFAFDMTPRDPAEAAREFFEGRSPFRTTPILRDPAGSSVVVHEGLLIPAIRERVEQQLKATRHWDRYAKHRGDHLEREALALLVPHFPTCVVHRAFEYFVPNPDAPHPETEPSNYTKLVEGDGLIIVDDVALIVEAKAGALSPLSRTGNAKRIASDLRKIVTTAAEQTLRIQNRILIDRGLRLRDGSWLDLDHVREVHAIAVSLDDLSGIATMTSELVHAGILSAPHLPWTVSLHDLRIITELIERPAELLLYVRRRTEPDVTRRFHAVDELDFFLEFYASGLYVEPDPSRVQDELPQFGEPSVAARRRFKKQKFEFLTSRTDQLDAWYFHQLGIRRSPAPKPRLNANEELCTLVDALAAQGDAGWLRVGTALLDASGPLQRKFARHSRDLVNLSAHDRKPHTLCVCGGSRADNSFVLIWASAAPGEHLADAQRRLQVYVSAKKHQLQVSFGAGLLFDTSDVLSPRITTYDNRPPRRDEDLDDVVTLLDLRPVGRGTATVPRPARRAKTTKRKR